MPEHKTFTLTYWAALWGLIATLATLIAMIGGAIWMVSARNSDLIYLEVRFNEMKVEQAEFRRDVTRQMNDVQTRISYVGRYRTNKKSENVPTLEELRKGEQE